MALKARYLADKSAYIAGQPAGVERFTQLMRAGEVATCAIVDLEILFSARSRRDYEEMYQDRLLGYERVAIDEGTAMRALEVQQALATSGKHRSAGVPDLMIAAAAEHAGLVLLHCDHDFEAIAEVTGQPQEMIERPRQSGPRTHNYLILVGQGNQFEIVGLVEATTPDVAVATAVTQKLVDAAEQSVVAVPQRYWCPGPASEIQEEG